MMFGIRCVGCGKRFKRNAMLTTGLMSVCKSCGRSMGITGARRRNVAVKNSKDWQAKPCKHQATTTTRYKKGRDWFERNTCRRCGYMVWEIKI